MKAKVILEVSYQDFKDWQQDVLEMVGEFPLLEDFKELCLERFMADRNEYLDKKYTTVYLV